MICLFMKTAENRLLPNGWLPASCDRGLRILLALGLVISASLIVPRPALASETYDECVRRECAAQSGYVFCGNTCRHGNASPVPYPTPPVLFGAIAVETRSLISGTARGYPTLADAERRAIAMCRRGGGSADGCKIVVSGHNVCLALATSRGSGGRGNTWGSERSDDGWVSRQGAVRKCVGEGGTNCAVAVSMCTG